MNLFGHFQQIVRAEIAGLSHSGKLPLGLDLTRIVVEPSREAAHGDLATNAAMVLAKSAAMPPRAIAQLLVERLAGNRDIQSTEIAGPGFINIRLKVAFWPKLLSSALALGQRYGSSTLGAGEKVNVEYVSANPTGPLHVGHCRGAVFGDALAELLAVAGFSVTREYYVNDAGAQVDVLARSAYLRYREALGEDIGEIPSGLYPGDYLKPVGQALAYDHDKALLDMPEAAWLPIVRDRALAMMMDLIREDLAALNIRQEVFISEKSLHETGEVERTVEDLRSRGLIYEGRLPPPKGEPPEDWEDREQTLFRATQFGDDIDRPLIKSDGSYTYFASDIAYSRHKIMRDFKELVYVLGADHSGYVKRLEAIGAANAGNRDVKVIVRLCQLVKLYRGGEPVRMSKRAGEFVTLRDVVDEVGADVVRFMMLYRKNEAPLDFDFKKVTEQSKENPVFYVQYAHARISSVFRNAGAAAEAVENADFSRLGDDAELQVIRRIGEYPRVIEAAAVAHEPHRIAFYLYDLASDFHALWNKGKESPQLRFILGSDMQTSLARLALLRVIRYVLANGLGILGVKPVEEM
ncbi:MAG: arginine--tRNA ligase [Alphaproteobacteria bacterium]|nr:MAG: arginine--tRNA ligase [Alphaproteobacteria bacterium]TMJ37166.1 MAG: arginine--tRNA ligase [Alphaproteobacteria bacterium]